MTVSPSPSPNSNSSVKPVRAENTVLQEFDDIFEALLACLGAIRILENNWVSNTVAEASGFLMKITDPNFLVCIHTTIDSSGYIQGSVCKIPVATLDIIQAYTMISNVMPALTSVRSCDDEYDTVYAKMGDDGKRCNVPTDSPYQYFNKAIFIPFLDALIMKMNKWFSDMSVHAIQGLQLVAFVDTQQPLGPQTEDSIVQCHRDDLPSPNTFHQGIHLWQQLWTGESDKPNTPFETLQDLNICSMV